ncbi:MAG: ATP-dependent DNA ligase [Chloroflexi bacterium]|nr:ATP-dependent DNA ligase [Chloroflexota bacterium]
MLLREVVETSAAVAATPARSQKVALLAATMRRLEPGEAAVGVAYLSGRLRQRQIGVGWASFGQRPPPAEASCLTLLSVDEQLEHIGQLSGPDSQTERRRRLATLLGQATASEQDFLSRLLLDGLRQGALEGVTVEALARAADAPLADLRRALMLRGDLGAVADVALRDGAVGLRVFALQVGRPLQPMLAQTAPDMASALDKISPAAVEWKLDGARVQLHMQDERVWVFTRTLDDITDRVPELVEAVGALPARSLVLDGEALALRDDGRPHLFQDTASRFGSRLDVARLRARRPLTLFVFDILHHDGQDLIDRPYAERQTVLAAIVPEGLRVPRLVTDELDAATAFVQSTLEQGHEGVVVKDLGSPYEAGRRGAGWLKVKPRHTLDLVILAVEWGHGRRTGYLSNLHLGARDPATGGFVMLGKTFKGLTDEMLGWQTERLLALERERDRWTVYVRPELVAEIAFDGIQRSSRYPGGVTLRFARVLRYRTDKRANEADTIDTVRALGSAYDAEYPGREP